VCGVRDRGQNRKFEFDLDEVLDLFVVLVLVFVLEFPE
jgi:hypothetical protein